MTEELRNAIAFCNKAGYSVIEREKIREFYARSEHDNLVLMRYKDEADFMRHVRQNLAQQIGLFLETEPGVVHFDSSRTALTTEFSMKVKAITYTSEEDPFLAIIRNDRR